MPTWSSCGDTRSAFVGGFAIAVMPSKRGGGKYRWAIVPEPYFVIRGVRQDGVSGTQELAVAAARKAALKALANRFRDQCAALETLKPPER